MKFFVLLNALCTQILVFVVVLGMGIAAVFGSGWLAIWAVKGFLAAIGGVL